MLLHLNVMPPRFVAAMFNPRSMTARAFEVPGGGRPPDVFDDFNHEEIRVTEMPAVNGIGDARSVAKLYGSAATGGSDLGMTPSTLVALARPAVAPINGMRDKVLHVDTAFSAGFFKPFPRFVFGSSGRAFGTPGAGGSFGSVDTCVNSIAASRSASCSRNLSSRSSLRSSTLSSCFAFRRSLARVEM